MKIISGKIQGGYKAATPNLHWQMPYFLQYIPELANCHKGTINVKLEESIRNVPYDCETEPIEWYPGRPDIKEVFRFTKIGFEIIGLNDRHPTEAWIYDPLNSPNRADPFLVEVLTHKLDFGELRLCKVHLHKL